MELRTLKAKQFSKSTNEKYSFYGDNVMAIASGYADDIAAIEGQ